MKVKIDPEFSQLIPLTTAEDDAEFERAVLSDGEIFEPLFVWSHQNILLDGHRRNRLLTRHPTLRAPKPVVLDPKGEWSRMDAKAWVLDHQLHAKRNLTDAQRKDLIGQLYKERKAAHGGDRKSEKASEKQGSNQVADSPLDPEKDTTAADIGKAHGVSERTVRRAEEFHDAVHSLKPETQAAILSGKVTSSSAAVEKLAKLPPKAKAEAEEKIVKGKARTVRGALPKFKPPKDDEGGFEPHEAQKPLGEMDKLLTKMMAHLSTAEKILGKPALAAVHAGLDSAYKALTKVRSSLRRAK